MKLAGKLIFTLTVRCKEAAALLSDRRERPLQWHERAGLRVHLAICRWCPRYNRFLNLLDELFGPADVPGVQLSADARARIQALLERR